MNWQVLTFHCLKGKGDPEPVVNRNLFVNISEVRDLLIKMRTEGYVFCLPGDPKAFGKNKVCTVTFDDGYYNNHHFLLLSEEFDVPFLLFPIAHNIRSGVPFIWDTAELYPSEFSEWSFFASKYKFWYKKIGALEAGQLKSDTHRPFTTGELEAFSNHPNVFLGLHGEYHQPLIEGRADYCSVDIERNRDFLKSFPKAKLTDYALPCGLYKKSEIQKLLPAIARIYTIDGGLYDGKSSLIPRVSLISPEATGRSLSEQIARANSLRNRSIRKFMNFRYSNFSGRRIFSK